VAAQPDCNAENVHMHARLAGAQCTDNMYIATDVHCFAGGGLNNPVSKAAQLRLLQMVQSQKLLQRRSQPQLAAAATAATAAAAGCCGSASRGVGSRRQAPMRLSRQTIPQHAAGSLPCHLRGTTRDSISWACTCNRRRHRRQATGLQLQAAQQLRLRQWAYHQRAGCSGSERTLAMLQASPQAAVCCGSVMAALQTKLLPSRTQPSQLQASWRQHRAPAVSATAAAVTPVSWLAAAGARRCPRDQRACPLFPPAACAAPLAVRQAPPRCKRTPRYWITWRMRPPRSGGR
jgi:hypothetical protein